MGLIDSLCVVFDVLCYLLFGWLAWVCACGGFGRFVFVGCIGCNVFPVCGGVCGRIVCFCVGMFVC